MRPLALLTVLCLTPVADACFLKCFFKGRAQPQLQPQTPGAGTTIIKVPVKLPAIRIYSVHGWTIEPDPEVPASIAGLPVVVRCTFDPFGHTPEHDLNGLGGSAPAPLDRPHIREIWIWDWWTWEFYVEWEFTYEHLPALASGSKYELRMKVGTVASTQRKFHTR
jgi:hypothetical protein